MTLQSEFFRGDPKLEAAAVSDPAHIVPGANGEHVRKIQLALIQLDDAAIDADGKYGPATAAAVLAYKQKRNIINRTYQTAADNIVGKMTMASLDREILVQEVIPSEPVRIRPVKPLPSSGRPLLRLGFKIDVDFPVFPDGNFPNLRLAPRSTENLEIANGTSGRVRAVNVGRSNRKICLIFDPAEPGFIPRSRLNPNPIGPLSGVPLLDGGTVRITSNSFTISVDAFHPGNAFIDATNATSANTLSIEVRAPKVASIPGSSPPTRTRPNSRFLSADDSEPSPGGARGTFGGRPVNPKGSGRKINIFGSQETPGFEDYTTVLQFSSFGTAGSEKFRPFTEDTDSAVGVQNGSVSDICIRDSPIFPVTIAAIRRMAISGCRLTFAAVANSEFIPILKVAFAGARILEEFSDAIVMELP